MGRIAAVICAFLALAPSYAQVTRSETTEGAERVITLENEHLSLVIFPDLGGRIGHIIDRATGDDLVYWDLTPDAVYGGLGGALDDRRNTFEQYTAELPADEPGHCPSPTATRTRASTDHHPPAGRLDDPRRAYLQPSQEDFDDYEAMVTTLPSSGAPVSEADPTASPPPRAWRSPLHRSWNFPTCAASSSRTSAPERLHQHREAARRRGCILQRPLPLVPCGRRHRLPYLRVGLPGTPAGTQGSTTLYARRATTVSHADDSVVAHTQRTDAGLVTAVFAAREPLQGASLQTTVRRLPDEGEVALDTAQLPAIGLAQTGRVTIPWEAADGTWAVSQRITRGGELLSQWQTAVVVGEPSGEFTRELTFPATARLEPVPGWER